MQQNLFHNSNSKQSWTDDEGVLWFYSEKKRDDKLAEIEKIVGTDKFGNLLNGQVSTASHNDKEGFYKFGITARDKKMETILKQRTSQPDSQPDQNKSLKTNLNTLF